MALCAMMGTATLTSCEGTLDDVFGEWSRPTNTESNSKEKTPSTIEETPLTIEAVEAGTIKVYYSGSHTLPKPITYTKNGVSTSITATTDITVAAGDVISFSSENSSLGDASNYVYIQADHKCYVYGNVMSMINDEGDFSKDKTISGDYALAGLFDGNKSLYNLYKDYLNVKPKYLEKKYLRFRHLVKLSGSLLLRDRKTLLKAVKKRLRIKERTTNDKK